MFRIGAIVLLQEDDENERKKRQKYVRRSLRNASNPLELPSSQYVCLFKKEQSNFIRFLLDFPDITESTKLHLHIFYRC